MKVQSHAGIISKNNNTVLIMNLLHVVYGNLKPRKSVNMYGIHCIYSKSWILFHQSQCCIFTFQENIAQCSQTIFIKKFRLLAKSDTVLGDKIIQENQHQLILGIQNYLFELVEYQTKQRSWKRFRVFKFIWY